MKLGVSLLVALNLFFAQAPVSQPSVTDEALTLVRWENTWKPLLPGLNVDFIFRKVRRHLAESDLAENKITVWIRPGQSTEVIAENLLHEIAHFFDWRFLT